MNKIWDSIKGRRVVVMIAFGIALVSFAGVIGGAVSYYIFGSNFLVGAIPAAIVSARVSVVVSVLTIRRRRRKAQISGD